MKTKSLKIRIIVFFFFYKLLKKTISGFFFHQSNFKQKTSIGRNTYILKMAYSVCIHTVSANNHPPATLDSSRSSNSASWCNASADSWGAPGKHNSMMLMLSKLPCGGKKLDQQR